MSLTHTVVGALLVAAGGWDLEARPQPQGIFGGEPAEVCQWPFVVAVEGGCSGVLVTPEHVLTAAHCSTGATHVSFGENVAAPESRVSIESCEPLPGGEPGMGNDLMVCRLGTPQRIPAVPIVSEDEAALLQPGTPVVLVGFGISEDGSTGHKRAVVAPLGEVNERGERRIGGDGLDTCHGDSGGPALLWLDNLGWRLVGVTSYGFECGSGGWYTQPHLHSQWIAEKTATTACAFQWDEAPDTSWQASCLAEDQLVADPCLRPQSRESASGCAVVRRRNGSNPTSIVGPWLLVWIGLRSRAIERAS